MNHLPVGVAFLFMSKKIASDSHHEIIVALPSAKDCIIPGTGSWSTDTVHLKVGTIQDASRQNQRVASPPAPPSSPLPLLPQLLPWSASRMPTTSYIGASSPRRQSVQPIVREAVSMPDLDVVR